MIKGRSHAVRVEMNPEVCVVFVMVGNEIGRVTLFLTEPPTPEILDTLLVSRRAYDSQSMEIHGSLNDVGWCSWFSVQDDGVPLQQGVLHEGVLVLLGLDTESIVSSNFFRQIWTLLLHALCSDLTCQRATQVQIRFPEFGLCLELEPP